MGRLTEIAKCFLAHLTWSDGAPRWWQSAALTDLCVCSVSSCSSQRSSPRWAELQRQPRRPGGRCHLWPRYPTTLPSHCLAPPPPNPPTGSRQPPSPSPRNPPRAPARRPSPSPPSRPGRPRLLLSFPRWGGRRFPPARPRPPQRCPRTSRPGWPWPRRRPKPGARCPRSCSEALEGGREDPGWSSLAPPTHPPKMHLHIQSCCLLPPAGGWILSRCGFEPCGFGTELKFKTLPLRPSRWIYSRVFVFFFLKRQGDIF